MEIRQVLISGSTKLTRFIFFLTFPSISFAEPTGIIFMEGEKPSRIVYTAQFLNTYEHSTSISAFMNSNTNEEFEKLRNEQRQVEMRVVATYENKTAPESIDMTLLFQCHNKMYRIYSAHAMFRDGSDKQTKQDWKPYDSANSAFPIVASKIACDNEQVLNAAKEVAASENGQNFSAFDKLGIIYIGDLDRFQAVDMVWKTVLADGIRPAYNAKTLTAQELKEWNAKLDKQLAEAKQQIAGNKALASAALNDIHEDQAFKKEISANAKKHTDMFGRESKQFKQLKWILGKTENEIVRKSGAPSNATEVGDARFLTYYNEYFIPGVGYSHIDNNGYAVYGGTSVTCELTLELRKGGSQSDFRVVDYHADTSNGGCRDLSWFNRD
ncbi:hypothetical protein [Sulfuricurvum sp.]|uniref:hypothetical protein n=1 Tax=Sulfuricurvum sp. TaxID=2025608 RepID=UPI00261D3238|nr:hypothetical protein [Sulfuricurvum sp.]MDD3597906.1 hypothetical protein [Sulfuricurvum sp.]